MATFNPDNYIKLFRLDDDGDDKSPDPKYDEHVVIIPAVKSVLKSMFRSEYYDRGLETTGNHTSFTFPEDGVNPLINFRHELEELFQDCGDVLGIAAVLWEDISRRLFERGFAVTGKQCSDKWEALYSEYVEIAQCDEEGRVSESKHFASFECLYKIRSKYIDSKILEDITEYLNSRSDCLNSNEYKNNPENIQLDDKIEITRAISLETTLNREAFSNLSNEEDNQILMDAINAAQNILEQNIKESEDEEYGEKNKEPKKNKKQEIYDSVDNSCSRSREEEKRNGIQSSETENYCHSDTKAGVSKGVVHLEERKKIDKDFPENQVFLHSENTNFCWDSDATQCFLDLRLYVETSKEIKLNVLRKYKSIVGFVSIKMLLNGYQVSERDCRKKWEQLLRCYNKEVKKLKKNKVSYENNRLEAANKYFWQIDQVLKKSGLGVSRDDTKMDFLWDEGSIRKLICIRIPMENAFSMFKRYIILWQYVSSQMRKHNFLPTYNECSIKWMELFDIYSVCSDYVKRGASEDDVYWPFYRDMQLGFEQNAKSTEAVINYEGSSKLSVGERDEATIETEFEVNSTPSASFSRSEIYVEGRSEALSSQSETKLPILETEGSSPCTLEVTVHHCNLLDNIVKRTESNMREISAVDTDSGSTNQSEVNLNTKIASLRDLALICIENNFPVDHDKQESLCALREELNNKKQIEPQRSLSAFGEDEKISEGAASNGSGIAGEKLGNGSWTSGPTMLLIKFKISKEFKFRDPLIPDIDLWKEIATDMQRTGHNVCHTACEARWYQLMTAYKNNPSPENAAIIRPEYLERFKLMELPFTRSSKRPQVSKKRGNANGRRLQAAQSVWHDQAVKSLVEFRLSEEIRTVRNYGSPVANKMQAAGYLDITPTDVTRKWSSLYRTYRKTLFLKDIGQDVKWQYFGLMDNYMKGLPSANESESQNEQVPFVWTPKAVQKLIHLKSSLEDSLGAEDSKTLSLLWKTVANVMKAEGFRVTNNECAMEWNFLFEAYLKTEKELRRGSSAVIGKYFIMMDEALKKFYKSNENSQDIDEPIDFSVVNKKQKVFGHANIEKGDNCDQNCTMNISEEIQTDDLTKKNDESQEYEANDGNVINLSQNRILPASRNHCTDKTPDDDEQAHNRKNNMPFLRIGTRNETPHGRRNTSIGQREDNMQSIISCNAKPYEEILWNETAAPHNLDSESSPLKLRASIFQFPHKQNILIQDRSVNSTGNIEEKTEAEKPEEIDREWSRESVDLLIDLKLQHIKKFPGWPRSDIEWDKVEAHLSNFGYNYTAEECRKKWNSLKTEYEAKMSEIRAKTNLVDTWPYFQKINFIYQKPLPENISHNFRYILPKKRPHDCVENENSLAPKKLAVHSNSRK